MGGTWHDRIGRAAGDSRHPHGRRRRREPSIAAKKSSHKELTGKLNLNTRDRGPADAAADVGPAKAERIVTWRKKNGGFKRVADLRRVKGFGYKTFKRLEPFLDIKGDTTLAAK